MASAARMLPDEGRVAWVDYAKGICIIMVVMMHSTLGVEKAAGATSWLNLVVEFAKPFRMPDFFLISGLFLARVIDRDWRTYLDKKVVHFLYFYVVWVLISWAMKSIGPAVPSGDFTGVGFDLLSALWEPPGTFWFIYMLPIFFVIAKLARPLPPVAVVAAAAILQMMPHQSDWFMVEEFCSRLVFFLIGFYAAGPIFAFAETVGRRRAAALAGLAAWALLDGVLVWLGVAALPGIGLALGLAGALAVISAAVLLSQAPATRILRYCGQNSIVIYLAFFVPMAALRTVLLKTGIIQDLGTVSLVVTAVAVAVPLLFHLATRRTALRYLFERPHWARLGLPRRVPSLTPAE
jgi:uncharacterized membrane protein YcfT